MAEIANLTTDTLIVSDILDNSVTQYQDGVKSLVILPSATIVIPNLQAVNSVALKALLDDSKVTVDTTVEPSNIIGMDAIN